MPVPTIAPSTKSSPVANTRPKTNGRSASEKEWRAAAEADVDDADLGAGEAERDRPPGQVRRRRAAALPCVNSAQRDRGQHGQRDDVDPDEDSRAGASGARAWSTTRPSFR